ncbi:MAG: DNA primase [Patescibacteria group bacterium]|nr:DNA primase [Patescibacteria group bacterium]
MSDAEEIKSRLNIVDIVAEYLKLSPAGANKKALCPFHNEKTPSFMVNEERQIFHCFGCGKGGDMFTFIQEIENVDFPQALKILADKAGVTLSGYDKKKIQEINQTREALKQAAIIYHEHLLSPAGKSALDYLKKRVVPNRFIKTFQLGFAPDSWQFLFDKLLALGFSSKDLQAAGLIVQSEKSPQSFYDRFRRRLMFPIANSIGEPVGFSARVLPGDQSQMGKYINTPQTQLYDKSRAIYGLHLAKTAIKKKNSCVILEGNLDVILSHVADVQNAVATCGTAITPGQLRIIQRYTNNISFAFDLDQAGVEASKKGIDLALSCGLNISAINLGEAAGGNKDVADLVKLSPAAWRQLSKKARPAMEYYFDIILGRYDLNQLEQKKKAITELLEKIALFKNHIDKDYYLNQLSEQTGVKTELLYDLLNEQIDRVKSQKPFQDPARPEKQPGQSSQSLIHQRIINRVTALFLLYPELLNRGNTPFIQKIIKKHPQSDSSQILAVILKTQARFNNPNKYLELISDDKLKTKASRLIMIAQNHFNPYNNTKQNEDFSPQADLDLCLVKLKQALTQQKLALLSQKIKRAEAKNSSSGLKKLLARYNNLLKTLRNHASKK